MLHRLMKEPLSCHSREIHTRNQKMRKKRFGVHNGWNINRTAWDFDDITHSLFCLCMSSRSPLLLIPACHLTASCVALSPVILATANTQGPWQSGGLKQTLQKDKFLPLFLGEVGKISSDSIFYNCLQTWSFLSTLFITLVLSFGHLIFLEWFLPLLS